MVYSLDPRCNCQLGSSPAPRSASRRKSARSPADATGGGVAGGGGPGGPSCNITTGGNSRLFNDFVCERRQRRRNFESCRFRGLKIDDELVARRLFDREVCGFRALED